MRLKRAIKQATTRMPAAQEGVKRAWVEGRRLGERAKFGFSGPPDPASAWLLASSGRSGSTWLGDMLAATPGVQQIFEPLDPRNAEQYRRLMAWPPGLTPSAFKRQYLRPDADAPQWAAFWEDVLRGRVRTYLTDYARTSFFPHRFLVKTIRANMMLGFVAGRFHPRVIFLARHPAAVITSMFYRVKATWPAAVQDILNQKELVDDHLRPWVNELGQIEDSFEALAAWWAVENRVALAQLAGREHYLVFYEHLTLHPREEMAKLLRWLDVDEDAVPEALLHRYSRMTSVRQRQSREKNALTRLSAWQRELSLREQRFALTWAKRLALPWYGEDILPLVASGPEGGA